MATKNMAVHLRTEIQSVIRDIPDFPKPGIIFKDITPLLANGSLFCQTINHFAERYRHHGLDAIVGIEARGFIFASALAYALGIGCVPIRKKGKLPGEVSRVSYQLEYGYDTLEIHKDQLPADARVVLIDDVLATGGTILASYELLINLSIEVVEVAFLMELLFLSGNKKLNQIPFYSLVQYH